MQIQGYFELAFEPVRDAFAALFEARKLRGGALCVRVGGETVVDLWSGWADEREQQVWHSDTLVNLFSCTKTLTAVVALQLVAEGRLALDEPLARHWPAFATAGKAGITLRQVLCHRAGLPALRAPLPAEALYDWSRMTAALAAEQPWWPPGADQGYAPMTYGWLVGELIRRADGREPGAAIGARIARPLDLDLQMGLADEALSRVARLERMRNEFGDAAAQRLMQAVSGDPAGLAARAFNNPPGLMNSGNTDAWRRMSQPAANAHGTARALAGFYSGLLDGTLLDAAGLAEMTREHSRGLDRTLLVPGRFGLGCWLDLPEPAAAGFGLGPQTFGHPGAGGCLGCADPERQVAFAFVTNTLGPYVQVDPRARQLTSAVRACLG